VVPVVFEGATEGAIDLNEAGWWVNWLTGLERMGVGAVDSPRAGPAVMNPESPPPTPFAPVPAPLLIPISDKRDGLCDSDGKGECDGKGAPM